MISIMPVNDSVCIPPFDQQNVVHFRQRYNWDCGLSCVLMILPPKDRDYFLSNFEEICRLENIDKSTWTIDLCYILNKFSISHVYFTKTYGVHSGYKGQTYYDRILQKDEYRITSKFDLASSNGLRIEFKSLTTDILTNHLQNHGPIILLINANCLTCDICKLNKLYFELRSCLPWPSQYVGHYIVLCAYNSAKQKFIYRNPSFKDRLCTVSYQNLDVARKSFGTDEDSILIYMRNLRMNST